MRKHQVELVVEVVILLKFMEVDLEHQVDLVEVVILMEWVAVDLDRQVDLVEEVAPEDLEVDLQEVVAPTVLEDSGCSMEAEDLHHHHPRRHTTLPLPRRLVGRSGTRPWRARWPG